MSTVRQWLTGIDSAQYKFISPLFRRRRCSIASRLMDMNRAWDERIGMARSSVGCT